MCEQDWSIETSDQGRYLKYAWSDITSQVILHFFI